MQAPVDLESDLRRAALAAMDRFADKHDISNRAWQEIIGDGEVRFLGTASDGRKFGIGYVIPVNK